MKKNSFYIIIILLSALLTSCSWQEYFVINNTSETSIQITYTLDTSLCGFCLFSEPPRAYKTDKEFDIDWEKPININDADSSITSVSFSVPPHTAVIIGTLSNDHYTSYNQYFINSRKFNLQTLSIISKEDTTIILPETFDRFFVKEEGFITLKIKN